MKFTSWLSMKISGYENIEIFIKTQGFTINKYVDQILKQGASGVDSADYYSFLPGDCNRFTVNRIIYIFESLRRNFCRWLRLPALRPKV